MAPAVETTRSGRTIKPPIQKYEQNCVMFSAKTAKYESKVKQKRNALRKIHNHRVEKKVKKKKLNKSDLKSKASIKKGKTSKPKKTKVSKK